MDDPSHPPKKSRLGQVRGLARSAKDGVFYVLACLVGAAGVFVALLSILVVADGEWLGLVLLALSVIPIGLPIVVFRERARDKALARFLTENVDRLAEGVVGPGGATYTFDTVLVYYQTRFSAVVLALKFDSGFYLDGPGHGLPKLLYTLFAALFGWWAFDVAVWIDNLAIIAGNLSEPNRVTVAQLLGVDESSVEEPAAADGAPLDPARLPD